MTVHPTWGETSCQCYQAIVAKRQAIGETNDARAAQDSVRCNTGKGTLNFQVQIEFLLIIQLVNRILIAPFLFQRQRAFLFFRFHDEGRGKNPVWYLRFVSTIFRALGVPIKFLGKEEVAGSNPVTDGLYLRVAQSGRAPNNTPRPFSFSVQILFLFFGYTFWVKSLESRGSTPHNYSPH